MMAGTWVPTVVAGWRNGVPAGADLITNDDDGGGGWRPSTCSGSATRGIGHLSGSGGAGGPPAGGLPAPASWRPASRPGSPANPGGTSEEDGYAAACWLLDHHPDTTAIFAANDTMALGALAALKARGLSVPAGHLGDRLRQLAAGQVAVSGHDLGGQPQRHLVGVRSAKALLARIQDPAIEPERQLIEPVLVAALPLRPAAS